MDIDTQVVEFGAPALSHLAAEVRAAKHGDPLAPVTVVVSSNAMGTAVRRALAAASPGGRGIAAVSFVTLRRLAEQLGAPRLAAADRRPVSTALIAGAVRRALADDKGIFADVATHPATEEALVNAHRELADLSDEALAILEQQSARAKDVVRVHRRVTEILSPNWFNEHDLVRAATTTLESGAVSGLGPVFVHLPRDLTRSEAAFLNRLALHTTVTVNLATTGHDKADRRATEVAAKLGANFEAPAAVRPRATRIRSVSDPDEEVRAAIHELLSAMRQGMPLGRTAVLYATREPYLRLLHDQLEAAGIPRNGVPVTTIGDGLFGRTLRTLLELPAGRFRRRDVLGLLAGAPIVDTTGKNVPSRAWERVSRAAGIVDGDDWSTRLNAYITETCERADDVEAEGETWKADQLRRTVDDARHLEAFVAELRADLQSGDAQASWTDAVAWADKLATRYLGGEQRRARWPEPERQAAERIEEALERLRGLDSPNLGQAGLAPPSLDLLNRTLDAELDATLGRYGRLGEGVLVGPVSSGAGLTFDLAIVLGMAEGTFPARRLEDSLLPDREREATGGELRPRMARANDDHADLLAVLAGAGTSILVFPRGDLRRRGERTASRWLLDDVRSHAGETTIFTKHLAALGDNDWWAETASALGGLRTRTFPATDQEYDLAALLRADPTPQTIESDPVVRADPVLRAGIELVLAHQSDEFTRFDGNLSALPIKGPGDAGADLVSPTRLEAWTKCPHAYFVRYVLGVNPIEKPERILAIDALDRGSLVHDILEHFINESVALGRPQGDWDGSDRDLLQKLGEKFCDIYEARGVTGRSIFWRRDRARILGDLDTWLERDNTERATRQASPLAAELTFGFPNSTIPAVAIGLPDGRSVRFRGKIDRVDVTSQGDLVVLDYKSGSSRHFGDLSETNPDDRGSHLQLRVYAEAARLHVGRPDAPVHTAYWFVSSDKGAFKWLGYDLTPAAETRMSEVLATIADGIADGVFPARPTDDPPYTFTDCIYCDPDELGAHDKRREWERKAAAASALNSYVALVEP